MGQLLTVVFLAGYGVIVYWASRGDESAGMRWTGIWSCIVVLLSITASPWIEFGGTSEFDDRVHGLITDPRIAQVLDQPQVQQWIAKAPLLASTLACTDSDVAACLSAMPDSPLKEYAMLARTRQSVSGFAILQIPRANPVLRVMILFSLLWATATLLLGVSNSFLGDGVHLPAVVASILAAGLAITALGLLWYYPIVDTLGYRNEFGVSVITFLAAGRVGSGIIWALSGTVLLAITTVYGSFVMPTSAMSSSLNGGSSGNPWYQNP